MMVITLAEVKEQLGITDPSYDAQITAKIPMIDAKVKQICNHQFNTRFVADMTEDSDSVLAYPLYKARDAYPSGINNRSIKRDITEWLEVGMKIEGDNIPDGAYIQSWYKSGSVDSIYGAYENVYVTLSESATATEEGVILTGGISIGYLDVIAKGVMWMINGTSTAIRDDAWQSKSGAGLSVTKASGAEKLDGKSGMPLWFVRALPRYAG